MDSRESRQISVSQGPGQSVAVALCLSHTLTTNPPIPLGPGTRSSSRFVHVDDGVVGCWCRNCGTVASGTPPTCLPQPHPTSVRLSQLEKLLVLELLALLFPAGHPVFCAWELLVSPQTRLDTPQSMVEVMKLLMTMHDCPVAHAREQYCCS